MRLGVLEDDPESRSEIDTIMASAGHVCHSYSSSRALTTALRQDSFDLLLLDWNLPDFSGLQLLNWARVNLDPCPPVIMVTCRTDSADIVAALEAGADDYVMKPVDPIVLAARVNALLRRTYPVTVPSTGREELWGAIFDHASLAVRIGGDEVTLTTKEFGLALALFRNMHRAMSRTHLLEAVWGRNPDLPTRTLDVHVSRLRARLGLRPERGYRLTPVHSFGYRLETMDMAVVENVA